MAVTTQRSAREVLGEEAVAVLDPWMEEKAHQVLEREIERVIEQRAVPRDEYREVLSRLDGLEKDVSLIKEELARSRTESREDRGLMRAEFQESQAQMRAEFQESQAQMRAEFQESQAQMRAEFKDGQAQLRAEFKDGQAQLRAELGELRRDMNERFDRVNQHFDRMHARFDEMNHRMVVQTRWFIGALTVLVTVVSALMAIVQFTP